MSSQSTFYICKAALGAPLLTQPGCSFVSYFLLSSSCFSSMTIRILVTGGTFDKDYNELNGQLFFKDTHLAEMLRLGRSRVAVTIRTVMMIDSLEMTDADRALIVQNCGQAEEDRIVITHGTDTMTETAAAIAHAITGKTVVLTGAMIPYAFGSSDGLFNLGSALSFAQVLPAGVYVAMNGKCFAWDRVRKNRERGEFEEIASA
jgi:L-asparaginase